MELPQAAHVVTLRVNGVNRSLQIEARVSLLDALRENLGLFGAKKGCNQGACGACTVLVDGERINSCLALAIQYEGRDIVTVEGLSDAGGLHPLQAAFIAEDGFQCGYCTPGQICSAVGMISEFDNGLPSAVTKDLSETHLVFSDAEIKERMSGNLCRCGAYVGITSAIQRAYQNMSQAEVSEPEMAGQGVSK
jgi:xanthine dehydrogenase YagT iron-sulfur-binding subunit